MAKRKQCPTQEREWIFVSFATKNEETGRQMIEHLAGDLYLGSVLKGGYSLEHSALPDDAKYGCERRIVIAVFRDRASRLRGGPHATYGLLATTKDSKEITEAELFGDVSADVSVASQIASALPGLTLSQLLDVLDACSQLMRRKM